MSNSALKSTFLVTAFAYLTSLHFSPYLGQFALKVLPIIVLLIICFTQLTGRLRHFTAFALIATGIGDTFLAIEVANGFVLGLGAFLIAQLTYSITFIAFKQPQAISTWRKLGSIGLAVFSITMATYILPSTDELLIPVAVYLTVITIMGVSALLTGMDKLTVLGAFSFISSDAILAQSIFKTPLPMSSVLVMLTYYAAQYFILHGLISYQNNAKQE